MFFMSSMQSFKASPAFPRLLPPPSCGNHVTSSRHVTSCDFPFRFATADGARRNGRRKKSV